MSEPDPKTRTFRNELWRSLPAGVLDTLTSTFGMLIAVRVFALGDTAKSIFLSATSSGMMISLFVVPLLLRARSTIARTAAKVQILGGALMGLAAAFPQEPWVFIGGLSTGLFCFTMQIPLLTQIYRLNYPATDRGRLFAITGVTRAAMAVAFGAFGGWLIGLDLENYRWLLWAFAAAGVASGLWTYGLPATQWDIDESAPSGLWSALRWIQVDRDFRTLLISWMLTGIGNLVATCLIVEYLANPKHGINLPGHEVAWITGVVPVISRVLFGYPWGLIYDRIGLFMMRTILNFIFTAGILTFYLGHGMGAWITGMALWGIANAGGNVTWGLWVTKLAPKHAVAEYMSVHTFLTGLRGLLAPYLAFAAIGVMSFQTLSLLCSASIIAASAFITVRARGSDDETRRRLGPQERL
ncbi:putative MFS family arabinose efflux permease [Prosthecobacter fusiformis]|uniref:Putative MFS family arabinose efflux permease n=1 Tax=Prosthecobacter fusiformis TaxID=48464 RepID=A0A4R7RLC7_9BACT|nr:MFS transporter [Prosthecobacter fusiformis]TDU64253.1 putative MFS family arabinose efflux permease [Prosthecobacter fusiformis]